MSPALSPHTEPCKFRRCPESTFSALQRSAQGSCSVGARKASFSLPAPVPCNFPQNSALTFNTDSPRASCVPGTVSAAGDLARSQSRQLRLSPPSLQGSRWEGGCCNRHPCPPPHLPPTAMTALDSFVLLVREKHHRGIPMLSVLLCNRK